MERARSLRREPTDVERKLWQLLRHQQLEGFKFRRQYPMGPFIADFACVPAKLVIELDGGQHAEETLEHDAGRDAWMNARGYRVLRIWNDAVFREPDGVIQAILDHLTHPHPGPPPPAPQSGEGDKQQGPFTP